MDTSTVQNAFFDFKPGLVSKPYTWFMKRLFIGVLLILTVYQVQAQNNDPVFTSVTTAIFEENGVGTAHAASATDDSAITYSLGSGNDENLFDINGATGVITFKAAPDFENPIDANTDNAYVINVVATDASNNSANQDVTITVTDVNENNVTSSLPAAFVQLGADIDGEAENDKSGNSISLSADGRRLAIGALLNDGGGTSSGHARIYEFQNGSWTQLGSDIDGEAEGDRSGWAVSLSADGSRVATGAHQNDDNGSNSGHVRIYGYDGSSWTQLGLDIGGEAADDRFGGTVALSGDGTRVAIGAENNDGNGENSGHVRIYEYNGTVWTQLGLDIDGEAAGDKVGDDTSVSLSSDGNRMAIGSRLNNGIGAYAGHVRIFEFNGTSWVQLGSDIDGKTAGDQSGTSVSLSSDGNRVAIGAPLNASNGSASGHVRIYEFNGTSWTQLGGDINGEASDDQSGFSVSLSSDGNLIAIGAQFNDGNGSNAGHVRIYGYDGTNWTQLGGDINGESVDDDSGRRVSLSADGKRVAISARDNDGNGSNAGHVRVYEISVPDVTAPTFTSGTAANFAENGTGAAYTVAATDDSAITYSLGSGNDESLFNIDGSTGVVTFKNAPDFENPADGNTDNAYVINVVATDAADNAANQDVTISVTDVNENTAPSFTALASHVESTSEDTGVEITFTEINNQANASDVEGTVDAFVVQAVSTGTLTIDGNAFAAGTNDEITSTKSATWTPDLNANGTLNAFTITAKDNEGAESTGAVQTTVNVASVNDNPTFISTPISETIGIGDAYSSTVPVLDPDFDDIDFSGSTLPSWLSLNAQKSLSVTTFAGSGTAGRADGTGTHAQFETPGYATVDPFGNIYVQNFSNIIKKITPEAVVTTSVPVEDGFRGIRGMVSDSQGNIFFTEDEPSLIHKLSPDGTTEVFVGISGTFGNQDGTGTNASIRSPSDIAIDENDNMYIYASDGTDSRIRKITPQGVVSTVFTTTDVEFRFNTLHIDYHPDGYLILINRNETKLVKYDIAQQSMSNFKTLSFEPHGLGIDNSGNILVSGLQKIYLVTETSEVEAAGGSTINGNNGVGTQVSFTAPQDIAIGLNRELYAVEFGNRVRRMTLVGGAILSGTAPLTEGAHNVTLRATDGNSPAIENTFTLTVVDDIAPVITSALTASVDENSAGSFLTATADDTNPVTWLLDSQQEEDDVALFQVNGDQVSFINVPDFENPLDRDGDNVYLFNLVARDPNGLVDRKTITVTVNNLNDTDPVFNTNPPLTLEQGEDYSYEFIATDPDLNAISYTTPTLPTWLTFNAGASTGGGTSFSTVVGNGTAGDVNGTGTAAQINGPDRMAVDANDNIYFIDGSTKLKKVAPDGTVSTVAGPDSKLTSTDPIVVASDGTIHLLDKETQQFHEISSQGVISAGVSFSNITDIIDFALDQNGSWLIMTLPASRSGNTNRIYRGTALDEASIERLPVYEKSERAPRAPRGSPPLPTPGFYEHTYFAVKSDGQVIWTARDSDGTTIGLFSFLPAPGEVTDPPRDGYTPTKIASLPLINAAELEPAGLMVDSNDDVFVSSTTDHNIYKLNTLNNTFEIYAGSNSSGNVDGAGTQAAFNTPKAIVFDSNNNLYVSDNGNHTIRIERAGAPISISGTAPNTLGDYPVVIRATDGVGTTDQSFTITVNDITDPVFTSGTTENFAENGTGAAHTVAATDASTLTYSLGTGNDEALFNIDGATGVVTFIAAPDFENPADGNTDNAYVINVIATDAGTNAINQDVTITVTDVTSEDATGPVFTSGTTENFAENGNGTVHTAMATDDNSFTFSLGNANDEGLFNLDANTGILTFKVAPDFENPADANTDNAYVVEIKATDQFNNESSATVTITVTDLDEIAPFVSQDIRLGLNPNANQVDITFKEGVFGGSGSGPVEASDFSLLLSNNTTVNTPVINSITNTAGQPLVGGETVLRVNFGYTGTAEGDESLTFTPVVDAIFDAAGNAASTTQTHGTLELHDETIPTITSIMLGEASGTHNNNLQYYIDVSFSEGVNDVSDADFALSFSSSPTPLTHTVTTVSGGAVQGNETTVRLNLTFGTGQAEGNTITVDVANNTIVDRAGNPVPATTLTTTLKVDQVIPGIGFLQVDANNSILTAFFTEKVFGDANASAPLQIDDLTISVSGGTATGATITSLTNGGGGALVGGEEQVLINFSLTGTPNGNERLILDAATTTSIFDEAGHNQHTPQGDNVNAVDLNDIYAPVFSSSMAQNFAENGTGTVYTVTATDANALTYALGTGNDESLFDISGGVVTFKNAPDFEAPADADTNNDYVINVIATDAKNNSANQSVTITVTNVDDTDPVFTSGTAVNFAENGTGTAYTVSATDANALTYALGTGNDESLFNISGGVITFKNTPDFEAPGDADTNNDYVIEVQANDGLNTASQTVTITVTDIDEILPVFTSGTAVNFAENGTGTAYTVAATDANALTYALGTGNDESLFDISGGVITFKNAPDFEAPGDGDTNNDYVIEVQANDGLNTASQTVTITVTDIDEILPVFTSGTLISFNENDNALVQTVVATDANPLTYGLGSGNDEALFNIVPNTGVLTFVTPPDFETPGDNNTDNNYIVEVTADDGLNVASQTITITVIDIDEILPVFTSSTVVNFAENGNDPVQTVAATDANPLTYGLGTGNDEASFGIDPINGKLNFVTGPDFESPTDADTDNAYVVEVTANDGTNEVKQTVIITVTDVDEILPVFTSGTAVNFAENGAGTAYTVAATDANALTYALGTGNDESLFNISGGVITFKNAPDFEAPGDADTNNDYVIEVQANDGLNTASQTVTITVTDVQEDVTPPAKPVITGISDDTGSSNSDGVTSDKHITVSGTAEANATIDVLSQYGFIRSTQADGSGNWLLDLTDITLQELDIDFRAEAVDLAGNRSVASDIFALKPDFTAPAKPVITGISDDTGSSNSDGVTSDKHITVSGTAEANATIDVLSQYGFIRSTQADGSGNWLLDLTDITLQELDIDFRAEAVDLAGNRSVASDIFALKPDFTAPAKPVITGISDDTGSSNSDGVTSDKHITVSGTAEANATIDVLSQYGFIRSTQADGSGNWLLDLTDITLQELDIDFRAEAVDLAGNRSVASDIFALKPDFTAPAKPVITGISDDTGSSNSDGVTSDKHITVSGTAEANATIDVLSQYGFIRSTQADGSGNWLLDLTDITLQELDIDFRAEAVDLAGNRSVASDIFALKPDFTAPAKPVITGISDDTGSSNSDGVTSDKHITVSGTAEANATIDVLSQYGFIRSTQADGSGNWLLDLTDITLQELDIDFRAEAVDLAGNRSVASDIFALKPDFTAPAKPVITGISDDTGSSNSDGVTSDKHITVSGTAEANATIDVLSQYGFIRSTQADGSGNWLLDLTDITLQELDIDFRAEAVDLAGNRSVASDIFALKPDFTAPAKPVITGISDDTGSSNSDGVTSDKHITVSGTAEANATIDVLSQYGFIRSTQADGSGNWLLDLTDITLQELDIDFRAEAVDLAGNRSVASDIFALKPDFTAPAKPVITGISDDTGSSNSDGVTSDKHITVSGTAEANATIDVLSQYGFIRSTQADGSGNWLLDLTDITLQELDIDFRAEAVDLAGNRSVASDIFALKPDFTAPAKPVITGISDDTGSSNSDGVTSDKHITVSGTAEANATIDVLSQYGFIRSTQADGSGNWLLDLTDITLQELDIDFRAEAVDLAGNRSVASDIFALKPDFTAPAKPVITGISDDTGSSNSDGVTSDKHITVSGTAEANATIDVLSQYGFIRSTQADGSGNWLLDLTDITLQELDIDFRAEAVDLAGNRSVASDIFALKPDFTAPAKPVITGISDDTGSSNSDGVTSDKHITVSGTAEANATIDVLSQYGFIRSTQADGSGNWLLDLTDITLQELDIDFRAEAVDLAGNRSVASDIFALKPDFTAPAKPVITGISDDTGSSNSDGVTSDKHITVSGTAEANATIDVLSQYGFIRSTQADGSGNWLLDLTDITLQELDIDFRAEAVDLAGNRSVASDIFALKPDFTAPAKPVITGISDDTGSSNSDGVTSDKHITVSGTAEANATIDVLSQYGFIRSTQADGSGNWLLDLTDITLQELDIDFRAEAVDLAGNRSVASDIFALKPDFTAPAVTLVLDNTSPAGHAITATFSEDVTGLTLGEISVTGGTASNFVQNSASSYSFLVSLSGSTGDVQINAGVAQDIAGNDNTVSNQLTLNTAPESVREAFTNLQDIVLSGKVSVFPNPADTELTIDLSELSSEEADIYLYDAAGTPVFTRRGYKQKILKLRVSDYTSGVYIVQVYNGQQVIRKKVMIRK